MFFLLQVARTCLDLFVSVLAVDKILFVKATIAINGAATQLITYLYRDSLCSALFLFRDSYLNIKLAVKPRSFL